MDALSVYWLLRVSRFLLGIDPQPMHGDVRPLVSHAAVRNDLYFQRMVDIRHQKEINILETTEKPYVCPFDAKSAHSYGQFTADMRVKTASRFGSPHAHWRTPRRASLCVQFRAHISLVSLYYIPYLSS